VDDRTKSQVRGSIGLRLGVQHVYFWVVFNELLDGLEIFEDDLIITIILKLYSGIVLKSF